MSHQPSRATRFLCAFCLAVLANDGFAQEASHGWERFQFTGNETFSAAQLRNALIAEPDFLLATHPHSDRADIAAVARRLLLAGYRNSGFKSPTIEVQSLDNDGATIRIDEGQRFRCGAVTITGANQVDVQQLTERLTKPFAKEKTFPTFVEANGKTITRWIDDKGKLVKPEKPIWELGAPAKFDRETKLSQAVKTAFEDLGYSAAQIQVSVATNDTESTAKLVVDILQEGDQDRADVFKIVGSDVNAPNEVRKFLELNPDLAIDQLQLQRLTRKLWDSGRFTKHNLSFDRDENGVGRLNIELADVLGIPALSEPLSETAKVFLRARTWLSGIDERGEDLSFTFMKAGCRMQFVQSQQGMLIQVTAPETSAFADGIPKQLRTAFVVDRSSVMLSHSSSPCVWKGDISQFQGAIRLETKFAAATSNEHFGTVTFNATWSSERAADEPVLSHVLNLSPADWSAFAYKSNLKTKIENGRMRIIRDAEVLEIDVATGEICSWVSDASEAELQAGLFKQLHDEISGELNDKSNLYQHLHPVTSLVKYMISEPSWNGINEIRGLTKPGGSPFDPNLRSGLDRLVSGNLLLPLDAFVDHSTKPQSNDQFEIPDNLKADNGLKRWLMAVVAKYTLKCAPQLFAEGTWPMTVSREACLVMVDRGRHTGKVIDELQSDESNGPLCDASVAYLLSLIHQPAASTFATRSLEKMEPARFDHDVNVLLSGPCGQWISGVLGAVASLTPDETDALGKLTASDKLPTAMKALQSQATLATENESLWYQATHTSLEGMLQELSRR